ncbi:hypothetical protein D3C72_2497020 [compost metagenome]
MAQTGARQDHCSKTGIGDVDSQAGRQQGGFAWCQLNRAVQTGAQIKPGRAWGGIGRQWEILTDTRVQNLNVDFFHHNG